MGKPLTPEQKANRKKGGMRVQGEQLSKYSQAAADRARKKKFLNDRRTSPNAY